MVEAEMTRKEQKKMESSSVCKSFNVQYTIYQEPRSKTSFKVEAQVDGRITNK